MYSTFPRPLLCWNISLRLSWLYTVNHILLQTSFLTSWGSNMQTQFSSRIWLLFFLLPWASLRPIMVMLFSSIFPLDNSCLLMVSVIILLCICTVPSRYKVRNKCLWKDMLMTSKSRCLFVSSCLLFILWSFKFSTLNTELYFWLYIAPAINFSLSVEATTTFPIPTLETSEISLTALSLSPSPIKSSCLIYSFWGSRECLLDSHLTYHLHCFRAKPSFHHPLPSLLH